MTRTLMTALALLGLAGCGREPEALKPTSTAKAEDPAFKDSAEELRYLQSLSNPTPAQFKRREELPKIVKTDALLETLDMWKRDLAAYKEAEKRSSVGEAKIGYRKLVELLEGETDPKLKALHDEAAAGLDRMLKIRPD